LGVLLAVIGWSAAAAAGMPFSEWSTAQKIDEIGGNSELLNTSLADGCPIQSADGLSLYMASNRDGYVGTTRNLEGEVRGTAGGIPEWQPRERCSR
jgi:hypothetical protein